jgi:hypothetical protein
MHTIHMICEIQAIHLILATTLMITENTDNACHTMAYMQNKQYILNLRDTVLKYVQYIEYMQFNQYVPILINTYCTYDTCNTHNTYNTD